VCALLCAQDEVIDVTRAPASANSMVVTSGGQKRAHSVTHLVAKSDGNAHKKTCGIVIDLVTMFKKDAEEEKEIRAQLSKEQQEKAEQVMKMETEKLELLKAKVCNVSVYFCGDLFACISLVAYHTTTGTASITMIITMIIL